MLSNVHSDTPQLFFIGGFVCVFFFLHYVFTIAMWGNGNEWKSRLSS